MAGPAPSDEGALLKQVSALWDEAKIELARLREQVQRAEEMGRAQAGLTRARSEREISLMRLGEQVYKMVEGRELAPPPALRRSLAEVRARDVELRSIQADVAAVLKEAEALADRSAPRPAARRKK
jgi:predicted Zn-dependent peptidase